MADAKKAPPKVSFEDENTKLISFLVMLILIGALVTRVTVLLERNPGFEPDSIANQTATYFTTHILPILNIISFVFSSLFIFGIAWSIIKLTALNKELNAKYHPVKKPGESLFETAELARDPQNRKWERVLSHLNTQNPNDWKFAILEADIMLADLLDVLQYKGATIAEKLKLVEPSDFKTLELAWEAHKIRNTIAHEGADFVLSEREARRVIALYREVFEEFQII